MVELVGIIDWLFLVEGLVVVMELFLPPEAVLVEAGVALAAEDGFMVVDEDKAFLSST